MGLLDGLGGGTPYAERRIVAAEWDERSVRLAAARPSRAGLRIESAVEAELPAELDVADAEAFGRFLAEVAKRAGMDGLPAATAVPGHQTPWMVLQLPDAPEAELWPMALMQARRETNLDGLAVEFCTLPPPGPTRRVLAASVPRETLERTVSTLTGAGLRAAAVGVRPLAVLRTWQAAGLPAATSAVVASAPPTEAVATAQGGVSPLASVAAPAEPAAVAPTALIDVGRFHTDIIILSGDAIQSYRSAPAGWGVCDEPPPESIAETPIPVSAPAAELPALPPAATVPEVPASQSDDGTYGVILPAAAPSPETDAENADPGAWVEPFVRELRRTLLAHSARTRTPPVRRLWVSAGLPHADRLLPRLAEEGFEVAAVETTAGVEAAPATLRVLEDGGFAGVLGLARQYLLDRSLPVDFRHPKMELAEKRLADAARTRRLAVAFAAVVAMISPLPMYKRAADRVEEQRGVKADYEKREREGREDTDLAKLERDVWSDKRDGAVPPNLKARFDKAKAEYQKYRDETDALRRDIEERRRGAGDHQRAEQERTRARQDLDAAMGRLVENRWFDALGALGEVYQACDQVLASDRAGGKNGWLTEYRLEPAGQGGFGGAGGAAAAASGARVVFKGRAVSSQIVQALVDNLNAQGGEAQIVSETPANTYAANAGRGATSDAVRVQVDFVIAYRPSFVPKPGKSPAAGAATGSGTPAPPTKSAEPKTPKRPRG